ncbi:hypothetical protein [Methylorubrum extorquens]|uniref:hypothetical protein n=1 Tax=Methylorubrum extorquens TaxID=408 RepID=UPI002238322B|nr:hypothetical protein [Methylorubrum extorquens]UYW32465.1 hypothetical protein OKB92_26465 [Methylorubrum extorquens]
MTPANPDALAEGADDGPTDAEIQAMREEAENFRLPAPPPTPVRGRYYLTECEHCGWVGSSEHCGGNCGPDDDDIVCPVCCSSICGDSPDEADTAKHGEAVYQRILSAEARAAQLQAEVEALKGIGEAARRLIVEWGEAPELPEEMEHALTRFEAAWLAQDGALAARAATAREGA